MTHLRTAAAATLALALTLLALPPAWAEKDKKSDRVQVKGDTIYRGSSAKRILAVEQDDLCCPELTDEELVKAFIRVSEVGGTALCFDLHGFNRSATAIDVDHVDTVRRIKDAANYRWMPTVVRVLGGLGNADFETRLIAVATAGQTFKGDSSILFWIDGPRSAELVQAFRAEAPQLTVLAPEGGDIDASPFPHNAIPNRPAVLIGQLPDDDDLARHAILPDAQASYAALETYRTLPHELEPFYPTTVGLSFQEVLDGWVMLFNGNSTQGWGVTGWNPHGFIAKDGSIVRNGPGGGSFATNTRYDNFILRLQWKLTRHGANSGIFLRAPRENRESKMGFEFQLMGDPGEDPHKNGTGAIYDVLPPTQHASAPIGHWNDLEIRLDGPHYQATLNGIQIQNVNFDQDDELRNRLRNGFIALQDHGNAVAFRNIRIKRL